MTPLRQRMVEDMQLRGLSEETQEAYVRAVRQLEEKKQPKAESLPTQGSLRQLLRCFFVFRRYSGLNGGILYNLLYHIL